MYPPADRAAVEESGTVKWYNAMKGFGFIASDRGGKDIFVHASALDRAGIAGLTEGQRVAVDVIDGRKGPEAAGLRLIKAAEVSSAGERPHILRAGRFPAPWFSTSRLTAILLWTEQASGRIKPWKASGAKTSM
jgi:cold shock CspA family protein